MLYIAIFLFLIASALILNALYKRTNSFRNLFIDVRKFALPGEVGDNLEIVNLGSNHSKFGFDYSGQGVKGENWAVGPQTFEYDFAILRNNAYHLAPGAIVIIPVCLLSFFLYRKKDRLSHLKYFSFLPSEDIVGYNRIEYLMNYKFPLLFHPGRVRSLIKDAKPDNRLSLDENLCSSVFELNKDADFWIDCWNKEFGIELPNPDLLPQNRDDIMKNIHILKKMIVFCLKHNLKPVLTILPVTNYLYSRFTQEFIDKYILRYIKDANQQNVPVFNYLNDSRFMDVSLYINSFFFNKKGRMIFTKQFIADLKKNGIL